MKRRGGTSQVGKVQLVLLEAVAKQAFIFETNRLRQNLGASQMIYESTTRILVDSLSVVFESDDALPRWAPGKQEIEWENYEFRPIEGLSAGADTSGVRDFEVIIATSGKAMVLVRDRTKAEELVFEVTKRVLAELPGMRVVGAIEEFEWGTGLDDASTRVHKRFDQVGSATGRPRFLRLPIVEDCALSGFGAARRELNPQSKSLEARSLAAIAKESARKRGIVRLKQLDSGGGEQLDAGSSRLSASAESFEEQETGDSWLALVHADGNGLGAVFGRFGEALAGAVDSENPKAKELFGDLGGNETTRDRKWILGFRAMSDEVEKITKQAFNEAVDETWPPGTKEVRLVPIVLGGDDLTALVIGRDGWRFAVSYLNKFKDRAARSDVIKLFMGDGLTSSAGIAFVKTHFPFSDAYRLAEELASSAKLRKPKPAVDFHVLYDSLNPGLARVRRSGSSNGWRSVGPFELDPPSPSADGDDASGGGSAFPTVSQLEELAEFLGEKDEEGRYRVPTSQIGQIRMVAARSRGEAKEVYERLTTRVPKLSKRVGRLFPTDEGTLLFDAVALADVTDFCSHDACSLSSASKSSPLQGGSAGSNQGGDNV